MSRAGEKGRWRGGEVLRPQVKTSLAAAAVKESMLGADGEKERGNEQEEKQSKEE